MVTAGDSEPGRERRRGEGGYNLVFLMVIVTVLNVLVAAALPAWTGMAQREKEEEAIFRGLQYVEAIRVFQARFGRLPVSLDELVKTEPRSIRQLWKDPLTDDGEWGLIFEGQNGSTMRDDGGMEGGGQELGGGTGPGGNSGGGFGGDGQRQTQGPLAGVYTRAKGDSMKVFNGAQSYEDWQFTLDLLNQLLGGGGPPPVQGPGVLGNPSEDENGRPRRPGNNNQPAPRPPGLQGLIQPGGGPPDLSVRWLGRPWPEEIQETMQANDAAANQGAGVPGAGAGNQGQGGARRQDANGRPLAGNVVGGGGQR